MHSNHIGILRNSLPSGNPTSETVATDNESSPAKSDTQRIPTTVSPENYPPGNPFPNNPPVNDDERSPFFYFDSTEENRASMNYYYFESDGADNEERDWEELSEEDISEVSKCNKYIRDILIQSNQHLNHKDKIKSAFE